MPIVPSRTREIQRLLAQLEARSLAERESAVARLTLLGERAVPPLLAWLRTASPAGRLQGLAVLSGARDSRALPELLALARGPDTDVARSAVELAAAYSEARTARALAAVLASGPAAVRPAAVDALASLSRAGLVEALEPLLDLVLDEEKDESLRLRALEAVSHLGLKELRPLLKRLKRGASRALAERALGIERDAGPPPAPAAVALLDRLLAPRVDPDAALRLGRALRRLDASAVPSIHGALQVADSPLVVRVLADALAHFKAPASIPALHRALERLGDASRAAADAATAETKAWIHRALATLGSRIALYDLREMLGARPARAVPTLLEAAAEIGDASLVPAIVALAAEDATNLEPCVAAFASIARRERLRRTSRVFKPIPREHRAALDALWSRRA